MKKHFKHYKKSKCKSHSSKSSHPKKQKKHCGCSCKQLCVQVQPCVNGVDGKDGLNGVDGVGLNGVDGKDGLNGKDGKDGLNGVVTSTMYAQLGSQPATVGAGQPFTYSTTILSSPFVVVSTEINPPFTTSGTLFQLVNIGIYEVNYQMTYPTDGGVVLYFGTTILAMAPLSYTMIGKSPNGQAFGSVIIVTTTPNSFLSVNAAAGNSAAIGIPPNSSTTNMSSTTVSIKQLA